MAGDREAEAKAALLLRLRAKGIRNLAVLRAIEAVPRRLFLPPACAPHAMRDVALPIGCGQTTPRPSVVARLLDALALTGAEHVLEIGTGSGFVTACLSVLAGRVDSAERYRTLAAAAGMALADFGAERTSVDWADGLEGSGRFDRILVNAVLPEVTPALLARLAPDGMLLTGLRGGSANGRPMLVRVRDGLPPELLGPIHLSPVAHGLAAIL